MGITAKVIADSVASDVRLTTLEVVMPRFILAEFNTHRMLSRNSASSRAIPVERRIRDIEADPFVPMAFGRNQKGMQAGEELDEEANAQARSAWLEARDAAVFQARQLAGLGVHKQHANRLLEPFAWHTCVCTATEWDNFFALRISPMAQPEIRWVAELMRVAMDESIPAQKAPGDWHLPYVQDFTPDGVCTGCDGYGQRDGREWESHDCSTCKNLDRTKDMQRVPGSDFKRIVKPEVLVKLSCARCARVSYLTHDGKRDPQADLGLYNRLASAGHMSPLEHAAQVAYREAGSMWDGPSHTDGMSTRYRGPFCGNFRLPWVQHRKQLPGESVFRGES